MQSYFEIGADPHMSALVNTMMNTPVGSKEWLDANRALLGMAKGDTATAQDGGVPGNLPTNAIATRPPAPPAPSPAPVNWNKVLLYGGLGLLVLLILRR